MKKDMIFFGTEGITSASANTVANLAKEALQTLTAKLNNIELYSTTVSLVGQSEVTPIRTSTSANEIKELPKMLQNIAKVNSLIAWLREAIKARDRLRKEIRQKDLKEWCKESGIQMPDEPKAEEPITEDDYLGQLPLKTRNRYYQLETFCSTIGKYIHPDGKFAQKREEMKNIEPNEVRGSGRDMTIFHNFTLDGVESAVEDTFFELQQTHRDAQKQLNSIKYECDKAVRESELNCQVEYDKAFSEYAHIKQDIRNKFSKWKLDEDSKISSMKIIIPDSLVTTFEEISKLGK